LNSLVHQPEAQVEPASSCAEVEALLLCVAVDHSQQALQLPQRSLRPVRVRLKAQRPVQVHVESAKALTVSISQSEERKEHVIKLTAIDNGTMETHHRFLRLLELAESRQRHAQRVSSFCSVASACCAL
jgi:hypothetical protein